MSHCKRTLCDTHLMVAVFLFRFLSLFFSLSVTSRTHQMQVVRSLSRLFGNLSFIRKLCERICFYDYE